MRDVCATTSADLAGSFSSEISVNYFLRVAPPEPYLKTPNKVIFHRHQRIKMLDKGLEMVCEGARTRATTGSLASQPKVPSGNNTWLLDYSFLFSWLHFQNFLPVQIPHHPQGRGMNNGKHDKPRLHKSLIHSEANICLHLTIHVLEDLVEQGCKQ